MPVKFDFVSPGIQLREIDQSTLEPVPEKDGILLIGRARSGPAMRPVKVTSLNDFVDIFGNPMDGAPQSDPWRMGNTTAPNYAAYAAQAYLAAGIGPVKYLRLLGKQKDGSAATDANKAGWVIGDGKAESVAATNTTAMGLWLFPSASHTSIPNGTLGQYKVTGTLGAIIYVSGTSCGLAGIDIKEASTAGQAAKLIESNADNWGFNLSFTSSANSAINLTHSINFDPSSPNYIRTVLNTDPTLYYGSKNYKDTVTNNIPYFLGETFDVNVSHMVSSSAGKVHGCILALTGNTYISAADHRQEMTAARTGWFIGPQPSQKKLFYLTALSEGIELQRDYYVKISDCKLGTGAVARSSFTLSIMKRGGANDMAVESFQGLTLDSSDDDYIIKRIGDINETWNASTGKFDLTGLYPNKSNYVRVTVNPLVLPMAIDLPIGFVGPKTLPSETINGDSTTAVFKWLTGKNAIPISTGAKFLASTGSLDLTFEWPKVKMTDENTKGALNQNYLATDVFGLSHKRKSKGNHDNSLFDIAHRRVNIDPHLAASAAITDASIIFTLDDICSGSTVTTKYFFKSGSYGNAIGSSESISKRYGLTGSNSLFTALRIQQFAAPFFGGTEGVDIRYADPFSNERIDQSGNGTDYYPQYTIDNALDMIADKDSISYELVSMPGIIDDTLNAKLMQQSAERGDNLAIVDFTGIYRPGYDREDTNQNSSITTIVNKIDTQEIDNSYAATYYPNVRIKDTLNGNDTILIAPPSVAGIGAIAKSEALSQPWFAPAGFNRGGLSRLGGSAGPIVVGTVEHLTKAERDQLYAAHVNPIARFPATGDTVIFGQRTLQMAASALDRINVRRLMIYLKRHIGDIAETILFDQNVDATWNRFKARADAVLSEVKTELGITEYKLILDKTTTTPDMIDRNIMYAKIFIKPARAIEFIAIDFIITRSGVEFE